MSLGQCFFFLFFRERHSIFYVCVTCCYLEVMETVREKARGKNNDLSYAPSKRKEEIKLGTCGCGSLVVPYFQPETSTDRLHNYVCMNGIFWVWVCVCL